MDFLPFYRRVLGQLSDILRSGGTVVMLVLREGPFNTAIRETEAFTIRHVRVIEIGGLYPHVFVTERA
jgi:tRNA (guanine6-N2)-methyltransferase